MSVKSIRLSELAGYSASEQEDRLADLTRGCFAPLNGDADDLNRRIADYETRYEMSSATMLKLYEEQKLRETEDICAWLMLLRLRERLGIKAC